MMPEPPPDGQIMAPISPGELVDKITILEIKSEQITDTSKKANVDRELELLRAIQRRHVDATDYLRDCERELSEINRKLWVIEDDLRLMEKNQDFGEKFVALARLVYITNDQRFRVKRKINTAMASAIFEEKSHA